MSGGPRISCPHALGSLGLDVRRGRRMPRFACTRFSLFVWQRKPAHELSFFCRSSWGTGAPSAQAVLHAQLPQRDQLGHFDMGTNGAAGGCALFNREPAGLRAVKEVFPARKSPLAQRYFASDQGPELTMRRKTTNRRLMVERCGVSACHGPPWACPMGERVSSAKPVRIKANGDPHGLARE